MIRTGKESEGIVVVGEGWRDVHMAGPPFPLKEPLSLLSTEVQPPSEKERGLIKAIIDKIAVGERFKPWEVVYSWSKAFETVGKLVDGGLSTEELGWLIGFQQRMNRCNIESRDRAGEFSSVEIALYPERYIAARAGGYEIPLLSPEVISVARTQVNMLWIILEGFNDEPMLSPNSRLQQHMLDIVKGNVDSLNYAFNLDLIVRKEERKLVLGRRRPGVNFHILPLTESVTT